MRGQHPVAVQCLTPCSMEMHYFLQSSLHMGWRILCEETFFRGTSPNGLSIMSSGVLVVTEVGKIQMTHLL